MPDPLDLRVDIGPDNEYIEDLRAPTHKEIQENPYLLNLVPQFLGDEQLDPLQILVQCEEADQAEGCPRGTHIQLYYETHVTLITVTRKPRP